MAARYTPAEMLGLARQLNPGLRFALWKGPWVDGGGVIGVWNDRARGFVPAAVETGEGTGEWERDAGISVEVDGVTIGADPSLWEG